MARVFGYARVSSREQNLDRQILALKEYVDEKNILTDKSSGKDLDRPAYQALKGALGLREGDTLIIMSLDRLSRNKEDIKNELQWFQRKKVRLKILDLPTSLIEVPDGQQWIIDMIQNILIEVLSVFCQVLFPEKSVGIPFFQQGIFPAFSGHYASLRMRACSIR